MIAQPVYPNRQVTHSSTRDRHKSSAPLIVFFRLALGILSDFLSNWSPRLSRRYRRALHISPGRRADIAAPERSTGIGGPRFRLLPLRGKSTGLPDGWCGGLPPGRLRSGLPAAPRERHAQPETRAPPRT